MLSLVDLLEAGTIDLDVAAELARVAATGGSFLTAAGPGGVGKTTLMGAMLAFLPPGTEIVTVDGPGALAGEPADRPQCLVVHEIGAGSYYGYLWGPAVAEYLDLGLAPGRCIASNLHAETYPQAVAQLTGPPLGASGRALAGVDVLAFMAAERGVRRVTSVWRADPGPTGEHRLSRQWRPDDDRFESARPADGDLTRYRDFLARAQDDGCTAMVRLRERALDRLFGR